MSGTDTAPGAGRSPGGPCGLACGRRASWQLLSQLTGWTFGGLSAAVNTWDGLRVNRARGSSRFAPPTSRGKSPCPATDDGRPGRRPSSGRSSSANKFLCPHSLAQFRWSFIHCRNSPARAGWLHRPRVRGPNGDRVGLARRPEHGATSWREVGQGNGGKGMKPKELMRLAQHESGRRWHAPGVSLRGTTLCLPVRFQDWIITARAASARRPPGRPRRGDPGPEPRRSSSRHRACRGSGGRRGRAAGPGRARD